ncbi:MAG: hypothetical protein MJ172_11750 [Clostridia bacterium]|nr:hypothetical protein [Clostridia bacterium]
MFKSDMRRLLLNPRIYISIIISLGILLRPLLTAVSYGLLRSASCSPIYLMSFPFASSDYVPFAAIFCVVPFADSFCEDFNSQNYYLINSRIGSKKYSIMRTLSVALSGGITMATIVAIVIAICVVLANAPDTEETTSFLYRSIWNREGIMLLYNGYLFYALRVLLAFLFGAVWATIGLFISTIVTNKYVTLITPFIIYQIAWYSLPGKMINPVYLLRANFEGIPSLSFVILYQSFLILLFYTLSVLGIRARVKV